MTKNEIEKKLRKIFQESCGIDDIDKILSHKHKDHLFDDLKLDSLGLLTLATEIENQFQILLPSSEEDIPHTVQELINFIERELPTST